MGFYTKILKEDAVPTLHLPYQTFIKSNMSEEFQEIQQENVKPIIIYNIASVQNTFSTFETSEIESGEQSNITSGYIIPATSVILDSSVISGEQNPSIAINDGAITTNNDESLINSASIEMNITNTLNNCIDGGTEGNKKVLLRSINAEGILNIKCENMEDNIHIGNSVSTLKEEDSINTVSSIGPTNTNDSINSIKTTQLIKKSNAVNILNTPNSLSTINTIAASTTNFVHATSLNANNISALNLNTDDINTVNITPINVNTSNINITSDIINTTNTNTINTINEINCQQNEITVKLTKNQTTHLNKELSGKNRPSKLDLKMKEIENICNKTRSFNAFVDLKLENKRLLEDMETLEKRRKDLLLKIEENKKLDEEISVLKRQLNSFRRCRIPLAKQKQILSKVFSESQLKILTGKKKIYWSNDDMAIGYTIRYMSSKRCYTYLIKSLKIPLPALSSVKRWATLKKSERTSLRRNKNDEDNDSDYH